MINEVNEDKELKELFDNILRQSIIETLESLQKKHKIENYAETVFDEIMYRKNITNDANVNNIEISYSDLEKAVKRELRKRAQPWLDEEISRLKKKLGNGKPDE